MKINFVVARRAAQPVTSYNMMSSNLMIDAITCYLRLNLRRQINNGELALQIAVLQAGRV